MNIKNFILLSAILGWGWAAPAQLVQYASDASGNLVQRGAGAGAAPQIVRQPQQQIVVPGDYATFSVLLADSGGCTYQWRFFGTNLPGQTSDSLLVLNVTTNNQGPYSVAVTNSLGGVVSDAAQLYIDSKGNGMPDSWELANFGNLNQNATGDFDGDGVANLQEFLDGTSPTNSASFRSRLYVLTDGGGAVTVAPAQASYAPTDTVTLAASPFPPNAFFSWTGDLASRTNPAALTMNSNKTVRAHFACDPPPFGIAGWWRAENDASDALGANPGTLSNGVSFAAGQVGQAFLFSGTNQEVKVPASPTLNVGVGNGLTIEAWIKPASLASQYPLVEWNDGTNWGVHFWLNVAFSGQGGPGCIYANLRDVNFADHYFFSPAGLVGTNAWQHVAVTYDRTSGAAMLFVNGYAVSSVNLGIFTPLTTANLHLGYRPGSVSYAGLLDEVTVYNRVLSPPEVFGIYMADAAGKCSTMPYITSPAQFPDAVAGTGYTQQVAGVLGALPVSYSLSAGTLPAGLALSPSGLISGVPAAPGSNVFALLVTDAAGQSRERVFGLRVAPAPVVATPPGLLAWWRAENNAFDSVGAHHGFLSNGVAYAAGELGQAFSFDGTNGYVVAPDAGLPSGNAPRTVEFWMLYAPGGLGNHEPFFLGTQAVGSSFYVIVIGTRLYIGQYGGGDTPGSTIATDGNWHHVALTYDGFTARMYVDGQLDAAAPRAYSTVLSGSFYMGALPGTPDRFKGKVDELAVYNRALSQPEIAAIYSAGSLGKQLSGPYFNSPPQLPDALTGQGYTQTVSCLFATLPVGYSVTAGTVPPGLTLSPGGVLSGTPTQAGSYSFKVHATDAAALTADQLFSIQVFAPIPPPPGIVSWWRGEFNTLDAIGTNNGAWRGSTNYAGGKSGQAFALDGGTQSIDIPDAPSLRPASLTIEGWALFTAADGLRVIFAKAIGPTYFDSYAVWLENGNLRAGIGDGTNSGPVFTVPFSPVLGQWYHIAFTFDDAMRQQVLYLNGGPIASAFVNLAMAYDTHSMMLGRDDQNGAPTFFLPGRIDEAAFYNRALGSNEIASIFIAGPAGKTSAGPYFTISPTLPAGVRGESYSTLLASARGTGQVTNSVVGGALPPGLSLSPAGLLSGTPAVAGSFSFTVRATDGAGLSADQSFVLQVNSRSATPAGIAAWWRAEGNGLDAAGANNAILVNATTYAPGKVGQAFSLSGANDALKIPDAPALRPASLTLEAWVMFAALNNPSYLFAKPLGTGTLDSFLLYYNNGILDGVIADNSGFGPDVTAPFTPAPGQWYHLAYTFDDSSKRQTLYINGVPVNTSIANKSIAYDSNSLELGRDVENGAPAFFFAGRIDEAAIYSRALGAAEIAAIYTAGSAGKAALGPYITTPPGLPAGAVGQPYSQSFASSRGTLPVTYSVVGGVLPGGVTLSAAGVLSGVPSGAGAFSFTVRVTDALSLFSDQICTLTVTGQVPPPSGLISWWRAEGDAQDAAGTNNGVLRNGVMFGPGVSGQAFVLDGIDTSVDIPDSPSLRPASVTIEAWVLFNAAGTRIVMGKPVGSGTSDSYQIYLSGGTLGAFVGDAAGAGTVLSIPFSPVLGQWYHVAFTFDDFTRQQVLYLNGLNVASGIGSKGIGYDTSPMLLGRDIENGAPAFFLQGRIDEAAVYGRALNAAEIFSLYSAGAAGKSTVGPYFGTMPMLPDAVVSQAYAQGIVTVRGTGPISYALTGGSLPSGLTLSAGGALTGTPASAGRYSFTVRATDSAALFVDQTFVVQVYAPVVAPAGLIGWWRGETTATDQFNSHNGTLQGNAAYVPGKVGSAFSLDGVNSYVDLGAWNAGATWSLEAWVNPAAAPGGRHTIFGSLANCLDWGLELTDGQFGIQVRQPGGCTLFLGSGVYPPLNRWHHLAATCDGAIAAVYVNGVLCGFTAVQSNYLGNATGLRIGSSVCCGEYFPGLVDEVSIYNRALAPAEVASIFSAGPAGKILGLPPIMLTASLQSGALVLSFGAVPGKTYTIQYRDALGSGTWLPLTSIVANAATISYTNSVSTPQQRFFRVTATGS